MMNSLKTEFAPRMTLDVENAAELMTPNPVSIRERATIKEALALLIDKGFSAAPVIDNAGRPTGVLSRSDLLVHDREQVEYLKPVPEYFDLEDLATSAGEKLPSGFQVEKVDRTRVKELMTPVVFSVRPNTPVAKVVEELVTLKVHRLFVVDASGVLVGVISALDVLKHLRPDLS
jgi:CBS domain-containing protein